MTGINQLAPPPDPYPLFFLWPAVRDTGTAVPNGPAERCNTLRPPIFGAMCHQAAPRAAVTRGLAKPATRQSEYYFCGDLTLWTGYACTVPLTPQPPSPREQDWLNEAVRAINGTRMINFQAK